MTLSLAPIDLVRFPGWVARVRTDYEHDLVRTGESPEAARDHAAATMDSAFPTGAPTPDNAVFDLVLDGGATVGYLWLGTDTSDDPAAWWVWDVAVDEARRGEGHGRAAMELAEQYARDRGATTLGLSVFGFNRAAHALYESLGYETTTVKMRKSL